MLPAAELYFAEKRNATSNVSVPKTISTDQKLPTARQNNGSAGVNTDVLSCQPLARLRFEPNLELTSMHSAMKLKTKV